jgi:hypothetical protein
MRRNWIAFAVGVVAATLVARPADARVAGGPAKGSCYATFEGVNPDAGTTNKVTCVDGSACDADGQVNNSCTIAMTICGFQQDIPGCTPAAITKFGGNGTKFLNVDGLTGLGAPACATGVSNLTIAIRGKKKKAKKIIQLKAVASGVRPKADKNKVTFVCAKPVDGGGGLECPNNPAGGPRQLDYTIAATGTDLDTGFSGVSHNFPVIEGAKLSLCLSGCDANTNAVCEVNGPTGAGSLNGATFGPPLPLFAAGVPVCVINRFRDPAVRGTVNLVEGTYESQVGGTATPIALLSDVFNTSPTQVCPKCTGGAIGAQGTCDSGPNEGRNCIVGGQVRVRNDSAGINELYRLSAQCPPGDQQGSKAGTVEVILGATTGTDSRTGRCPGQLADDQCGTFGATCSVNCDGVPDTKGGINQWCCSDASRRPCFPTAANSAEPNHAIVRTGAVSIPQPAWPDPTYPKTGENAKTAATFCIGDTGSSTVNVVAGIPGPGAVIFNGKQEWFGNK